MPEILISKRYDLEDRTLAFAKSVRDYLKRVPQCLWNYEYGKQLIRSSSSIGANYIEANEALSRKDFVYRAKVCRKEAKETKYWLKLIDCNDNEALGNDLLNLLDEVVEILKIFSAIIVKSENKN